MTTNTALTEYANVRNAMVNVMRSTDHGYTHLSTDEWAKALRRDPHTLLIRKLVWCIPAGVDTRFTFQALASVHSLHLQVPDGMEVANFKLLPLKSLNINGGKLKFLDLALVAAGPSCMLTNLRLLNTTLVDVHHHAAYTTSCSQRKMQSRSSQLDTVSLRNVTGLTMDTARILLGSAMVSSLSVHECSVLHELPDLNLSRCSVLRTDTVANKLVAYIVKEWYPDRWNVIALTGYIKPGTMCFFFKWCAAINLPNEYALLSCKGYNCEQREMCLRSVSRLYGPYVNGPRMTLILQNQGGVCIWKLR
jgi:hypothetical protein